MQLTLSNGQTADPTTFDPNPPDAKVAKVQSVIKGLEGGDYNNRSGDGGSSAGAYQWNNDNKPLKPGELPSHWKNAAAQYLKDSNAPMTPDNQNFVAYQQIKAYKDQGRTPEEIDALWNGAKKDPTTGTYVHVSQERAQKFRNAILGGTNTYNPKPYSNPSNDSSGEFNTSTVAPVASDNVPAQQDQSFLGKVGGDISSAFGGAGDALSRISQGKVDSNPLLNVGSGLLQGAGSLAGGVGNITNDVLGLIPGVKQAEGVLGKGVQAVASTPLGQKAVGAVQGFQQAHPEISADIGAVGNIATAIPSLKAASMLGSLGKAGLSTALHGSEDAVAETIAPKLTGKALAKAVAERGTSKKGLLGEIKVNPDPKLASVSDALRTHVPGFNPSKPLTENIAATQRVVDTMAADLKKKVVESGKDRIYPFKELQSRIANAEEPISLRGTPFEKQIGPLKDAAIALAQKEGGKVSNLLDVRKGFDALVSKHYPTLWDRESAPMRNAVKAVRDAITTFTEEKLPEGTGLKDSLLTQHKLIKAIEGMASKVGSGATKEIGTTNIGRLAKKHPMITGLLKTGAKYGAMGAGMKGAADLIP